MDYDLSNSSVINAEIMKDTDKLHDAQFIRGAYSLLKDLLPHLNEDSFASLQYTIQKLLCCLKVFRIYKKSWLFN